jgi:hypothetical protein
MKRVTSFEMDRRRYSSSSTVPFLPTFFAALRFERDDRLQKSQIGCSTRQSSVHTSPKSAQTRCAQSCTARIQYPDVKHPSSRPRRAAWDHLRRRNSLRTLSAANTDSRRKTRTRLSHLFSAQFADARTLLFNLDFHFCNIVAVLRSELQDPRENDGFQQVFEFRLLL